MEQYETCYFCTSTYQLFPILSLALERKEKADLYIDPQFADAQAYADRLRGTALFKTVHVINSEAVYAKYYTARKGFINHLEIARSYLHAVDIARMILGGDKKYRHIFVSSRAYLPRMVELAYLKQSWAHEVIHFDDGIGSYIGNNAYRPRVGDRLMRWVLFGPKANRVSFQRYLFSPRLFEIINPTSRTKIHRIAPFWERAEYAGLVDSVFGTGTDQDIPEKVIFLDQPLWDLVGDEEGREIDRIKDEIIAYFGSKNCLVKLHPRGKSSGAYGCRTLFNPGIPFEILCMKNDMSRKIIVTFFSTAAVTPRMLLGQEPCVVFLCKLASGYTIKKEFDRVINGIKQLYGNKSKIVFPERIDELWDALNMLQNDIGE